MKIVKDQITLDELKQMSQKMFSGLVKAVVDVEQEIMAVDAELHVDLEELLLEAGSEQHNLWGINFHPDKSDEQWIEFDSMINIRPNQGNRNRYVENPEMRNQIISVANKLVRK